MGKAVSKPLLRGGRIFAEPPFCSRKNKVDVPLRRESAYLTNKKKLPIWWELVLTRLFFLQNPRLEIGTTLQEIISRIPVSLHKLNR